MIVLKINNDIKTYIKYVNDIKVNESIYNGNELIKTISYKGKHSFEREYNNGQLYLICERYDGALTWLNIFVNRMKIVLEYKDEKLI